MVKIVRKTQNFLNDSRQKIVKLNIKRSFIENKFERAVSTNDRLFLKIVTLKSVQTFLLKYTFFLRSILIVFAIENCLQQKHIRN